MSAGQSDPLNRGDRPSALRARRRAFALILVLFSAALAAVLAYAFVASQSTLVATSSNAVNAAAARAIAESGLRLTIEHIRRDTDWRTTHTEGLWVTEPGKSISSGTFIVRGDDGADTNGNAVISNPSEGDGSISDDPLDLLTLTSTGRIGGTVAVLRAVITPTPNNTLRVLMLVSNTSSLSAEDAARKSLMESWGWTVTPFSATASTSSFTAALATTDVVYVPRLITSASTAGSWNFDKGLVSESGALGAAIGFASSYNSFTLTGVNITNNTHEITSGLATGSVTMSSTSGSGAAVSGTLASGAVVLASQVGRSHIVALDTGAYRSGTTVTGLLTDRYVLSGWQSDLGDVNWNASPTSTATVSQINVAQTTGAGWTGGPTEHFGIRFYGGLVISSGGSWTFSLNSDDGSVLWIDGAQVIDNDGLHAMQTRTGTVSLSSGTHTIEVKTFENTGDFGCILSWRGPGVSSDTVIPSSAFVQLPAPARRVHIPLGGMVATDMTAEGKKLFRQAMEWAGGPTSSNGVLAEYFDLSSSPSNLGSIDWDATPTASDNVPDINVAETSGAGWSGGPTDDFAIQYSGFVKIPTAGSWTFELRSDDGSSMVLDGTTLITNDGLHSMQTVSGTRTLTAGNHALLIRVFERGGIFGCILSWRGPGVSSTTVVPTTALSGGQGGGYTYSIAYVP